MKKKFLVILFFLILIAFICIYLIYPFIQKRYIIANLKDKWNINIEVKDKLIAFKKGKKEWHGEQQKFILIESTDQNILYNYDDKNINDNKIDFNMIKRVVEIEDILNVEKNNRVNFNSNYYYKIYIKNKVTSTSEQKNDLLYFILIKEEHKLKMFFVEDLNILDLERSKFN